MAQAMQSEGAWVVNMGVEGTNGATCGLSMHIDGLGGMMEGVGGKVNNADEIGAQFWHVPGCRGLECSVCVCLDIPPVYT